jgi:hypothetical protein
MGWNVELSSV